MQQPSGFMKHRYKNGCRRFYAGGVLNAAAPFVMLLRSGRLPDISNNKERFLMKKIIAALLILLIFALVGCAADGEYPAKSINGIVQWGAGGGTDTLMRPLASLAGDALGQSIVVKNMTGGTGSVAAGYVHDRDADGYTLLMGAENPALYSALGIAGLTYDDFDCVFLIGDESVGIIVKGGSEYTDFTSLINAALAKPGTLKLSTTGVGGLPWEVAAFITDVTGAVFNQIPYDSDASARTAVINGECDFTVCKIQSGLASHLSGDIRFLTMFAEEPLSALPDVPAITAEYPGFEKYLPWGPFYGIFVKKGTDPAIASELSAAFAAAFDDKEYRELLEMYYVNPLGLSGAAADDYISGWQKNTVDALRRSGAIKD